jgi:hypothetical protein
MGHIDDERRRLHGKIGCWVILAHKHHLRVQTRNLISLEAVLERLGRLEFLFEVRREEKGRKCLDDNLASVRNLGIFLHPSHESMGIQHLGGSGLECNPGRGGALQDLLQFLGQPSHFQVLGFQRERV